MVATIATSRDRDTYNKAYRIYQLQKKKIESECKGSFDVVGDAAKAVAEAKLSSAKTPKLCGKKRPASAVTPDESGTGTRSETVLNMIKASPIDTYDILQSQRSTTKRRLCTWMAEGMKKIEELQSLLDRIHDEPTALDILTMFDIDFPNQKFVDRAVESREVADTGSIAPRKSGFDDMCDRLQENIGNVMASLALKIAQTLLPQDSNKGHGQLLKAMVDSSMFQRFVFPNSSVYDAAEAYEDWASHPAIQRIKKEVESLGKSNYQGKSSFCHFYPAIQSHGYPV
jgi:hypothetical protein